MAGDAIRIRFEQSLADPTTAKFLVDRAVYPGGPFFYDDAASAAGSPLPERIFAIDGVTSVLIHDSVVAVSIERVPWGDRPKAVGGFIRDQIASGAPALDPNRRPADGDPALDQKIATAVERVLEAEINPGIAGHDGRIDLVKVEDRVVYVTMSGGCQGCGASQFTLKQGVDVAVRRVAPEVRRIVDVTDHAAGQNPYFTDRGDSPFS